MFSASAYYDATYGSPAAVVVLLMWLFLSAYSSLIGASINVEAERQAAHDTTTGPERPIGKCGGVIADTGVAIEEPLRAARKPSISCGTCFAGWPSGGAAAADPSPRGRTTADLRGSGLRRQGLPALAPGVLWVGGASACATGPGCAHQSPISTGRKREPQRGRRKTPAPCIVASASAQRTQP